jgi:hypothetical protein
MMAYVQLGFAGDAGWICDIALDGAARGADAVWVAARGAGAGAADADWVAPTSNAIAPNPATTAIRPGRGILTMCPSSYLGVGWSGVAETFAHAASRPLSVARTSLPVRYRWPVWHYAVMADGRLADVTGAWLDFAGDQALAFRRQTGFLG